MTETLYRKSWQPLAEADKSAVQLGRWISEGERSYVFLTVWSDEKWVDVFHYVSIGRECEIEFLCLEPVEVETDDFPKVI